VKVKTFRLARPVVATVAQGRTILRGFGHLARKNRFNLLFVALFAIFLFAILFPHDRFYLAVWRYYLAIDPNPYHYDDVLGTKLARIVAFWGDYPTYNLPLSLLLWLFGLVMKSSAWRRIAVICFLGGTLAGSLDDCLRFTAGRPRPDMHLPDGFYGLPRALHNEFQSFPSGHAAATFGTAVALLVTETPLGLLAAVYALLVIWSRMELFRHYPSDIVIGALLGIVTGLLVGFGAKVRLPRRPPSPSNSPRKNAPSKEELQPF